MERNNFSHQVLPPAHNLSSGLSEEIAKYIITQSKDGCDLELHKLQPWSVKKTQRTSARLCGNPHYTGHRATPTLIPLFLSVVPDKRPAPHDRDNITLLQFTIVQSVIVHLPNHHRLYAKEDIYVFSSK